MYQRANDTHVLMSSSDLILLERWLGQGHALCQRLRDALADCTTPHLQDYRNAAMSRQCDGELEIDPGAVVSKGEQELSSWPGSGLMPAGPPKGSAQ